MANLTPAERTAKWRKDNPDKAKAASLRSRQQRKEKWSAFLASERERYRNNAPVIIERQKAIRAKDPEVHRARVRRHYRENKARFPAYVAARKARKLNATPPWVDMKAIEAIYIEAKRITGETGVPHEVDHIHPLKSDTVCGLHVPWNLQILPRADNRSKANRLII